MKRWLLIFALAAPLMAQNTRFDLPITTVQAQGGNLLPVYAIPGAGIKFYSCSGSVCTTLATTYISATSGTTCPVSPTPMQVTLNGSSTCVSTADPYGNMGAWFQAGQYMATITAQGGSYNYYFTVGSGSAASAARRQHHRQRMHGRNHGSRSVPEPRRAVSGVQREGAGAGVRRDNRRYNEVERDGRNG